MKGSLVHRYPSFRKQQLLLDFTIFKDRFPEGFYLFTTPGDPSVWPGVFFVRSGPYVSAVLRFKVHFPEDFPEVPPLITVLTDIFHPLLVPLTTYTFASAGFDDTSTTKTKEEDKLPPGAFCFRHALPSWFAPRRPTHKSTLSQTSDPGSSPYNDLIQSSPSSRDAPAEPASESERRSIVQVLEYMKSAFENADLLDDLPLEYVGNPGAWHAWRAYRGLPKMVPRPSSPPSPDRAENRTAMKHQGEWDWDGVFEARVRNGVEASISEAALFGSAASKPIAASNDPIRFIKLDAERYQEARRAMVGLEAP